MLPDPAETTPADAVIQADAVIEAERPFTADGVPKPREPFWGYLDLLLVAGFICVGFVAMAILAAVIGVLFPALGRNPLPLALPLQIVFYIAVYVGFIAIFRLRYNRPALASLGWRRTGFNPALACGLGAALAIVLSVLGQLLHTPQNDLIDKLVNSWTSFALFAVTAILIAPVFEELLFRGFLQPLLSRTFGVIAGVLITAALFGSLHLFQYALAWQYAAIIFLAGVAFGWVRARTGSVIPGTLMHCCFNSVSVIVYAASAYSKFK
jgi:uncharacterized protein